MIALTLFGTPQIEVDHQSAIIHRRKMLAMLAYLAIAREPQSRAKMAAMFWPESGGVQAYAYLRRDLATLKKDIGGHRLAVHRDAIGLARPDEIDVDVHRFRNLQAQVNAHAHRSPETCPACLGRLKEAADLYRDDFMAGFTLPDCPEFDEWQYFEREALRKELASILDRLSDGLARQSGYAAAIQAGLRSLALDPLHEPAHRRLMLLHAWNGSVSAALHQYRKCARLLQAELGAVPEAETQSLYQALLRHEIPPPPGHADETRQEGGAEPVARKIRPPAGSRLPAAPTPFVGREQEMHDISVLLSSPGCRMLTLFGSGGVGKTRLAIEGARQAQALFPNGVYMAPLASVGSAEILIASIADAVGFHHHQRGNPKTQLMDFLREKKLLLILDNFEHLVDYSSQLVEILEQAPGVKLILTSRERLNLEWEWVVEVTGLTYPMDLIGEAKNLLADSSYTRCGALQLLLQNIRRLQPGFTPTEENIIPLLQICREVEGIPLALEMAAAWVRLMPLEEILAEIRRDLGFLSLTTRDQPARHRSIRNLFEHSWNLLSEAERDALERLAVFQGSFDRASAFETAGSSLAMLSSLVDKSMLQPDQSGRFHMQRPLHQFVREKLDADPQKLHGSQAKFTELMADFLESQEERLKGPEQERALKEISVEIDNVREAWRLAAAHRNLGAIDRSLDALHLFYFAHSWYQEAEQMFRDAAAAIRESANQTPGQALLLGRLLAHRGRFAFRLGKDDLARDLLNESLQIYSAIEDQDCGDIASAQAFALYNLSEVARSAGHYEEAEQFCRESLEIYRSCRNMFGLARSLNHLGILSAWRGQYEQGRELLQQALHLYRTIGYRYGIANTLNDLAILSDRLEQYDRARDLNLECLTIRRQIGHLAGIGASLNNLGLSAYFRGDYREAMELLQESLEIQREIGDRYEIANCLSNLGGTARALDDLAASGHFYREGLRISLESRQMPLIMEILAGIAANSTAGAEPDLELAVELFTFIERHPASDPPTLTGARAGIEQLEKQLDEQAFAAMRRRGAETDLGALSARLIGAAY